MEIIVRLVFPQTAVKLCSPFKDIQSVNGEGASLFRAFDNVADLITNKLSKV